MPNSDDNIEARVTALEHGMAELTEQVAATRADAAAARVLAGAADRDVSAFGAKLDAHTKMLNALRETQVEHGGRLDRVEQRLDRVEQLLDRVERVVQEGFAEMRHGFATLGTGMARITALLTRTGGSDQE